MEKISKKKAIRWTIATVFVPLAASMVFSNVYLFFWYLKTGYRGKPPVDVIQTAVMHTGIFGLWFTVGLWWLMQKREKSFADLFGTRTDSFLKDFLIGLLLGGFWAAVYGLIGWPSFSSMFVLNFEKLKSVPVSLSAGFCEEFLFRGFVILMIASAGGTQRSQIIWSSLAFGAAHLFWGPVGMLFTVAFGVTFAIVRIKRGSVWPAVVAHCVLNLCIEPALMNKVMSFVGSN